MSELSLMLQGWGWGGLRIQIFTVIQVPQTLYCVRPCFSAFMVTQEQVLYTVFWSLAGREATRTHQVLPTLSLPPVSNDCQVVPSDSFP